MLSRSDIIRAQHDRGKKRKETNLNLIQREKKSRVNNKGKKRKVRDFVDLKQRKIKFGKLS
jgi:hypothetical protein